MTSEGDTAQGAAVHHFAGMNVWDLLSIRARRSADRPFLVWQPFDAEARTWTFEELLRDASAVAVGLSRRGIQQGDRILIHLDNCPEFVISWLACAALGAVAVTTNARSAVDELAFYASDCAAVGAITQPRLAGTVQKAAPSLRWLAVTDNDAGVPADSGYGDAFGKLAGDPDELQPAPAGPEASMNVQYTSGTTSRPKGVVWTHANALWAAKVNASHEDLHPEDCHLIYHPLFHANALGYSLLPSLWVGARAVLVPKWSTSRFWDVSRMHQCTWLSLMNLSYRALAGFEATSDHSYRLFGTGMCDTPLDKRYGVKTVGWWGMTETVSHPIVGSPHFPDRPMSMGRPAPEYAVRVVQDDLVTPVEPEGTGHLLVRGIRGLSLFSAYLNNPGATADSFDEMGWFRTGDLVIVHPDGYLTFADRAKDMLRVGGENVAASEIERVLLETGRVSEAAVVGAPDEKLDEVPVAFVVPRDSAPDLEAVLMTSCNERLADFKVPRHVIPVRDLPRVNIGKVNKVALRRLVAAAGDIAAAEEQWVLEND